MAKSKIADELSEGHWMIEECDEDDWPNDDEANDIMLAYAATDDLNSSGSGCAGVVLVLTMITFTLIWSVVH